MDLSKSIFIFKITLLFDYIHCELCEDMEKYKENAKLSSIPPNTITKDYIYIFLSSLSTYLCRILKQISTVKWLHIPFSFHIIHQPFL